MVTYASPRVSLAPYPEVHLSHFFRVQAENRPNHIALVDAVTGAEHTFRDTYQAASRLARRLQEDGIKKGDRVAIFAPNSPEYVVAFHAILLAGATVTTMNPLYRERELEHQLHDSGATALFAANATQELSETVWGKKEGVYTLDDAWLMAGSSPGEHRPVDINPVEDVAVLPYSSGTTGGPKGVMLTHFSVASNIRQTITTGLLDGYAVLVDFLPFFHIYGMVVLMNSGLAVGAKQVVMPRFDPEVFLRVIGQHQATNLFVVPPVMLAMANLPESMQATLNSVRFIMSGAAPLPVDVARRVSDRYGVTVLQGYGMTEASPVTHVSMMGRDKIGTVGPPVSDTTQKVVDLQSGKELGFDEVGELLIEGPQVMKGYWQREDATEESILVDSPAASGDEANGQRPHWRGRWLRTGDIVSMDDEGYVTVHDRAKEMIKYKGYQIAPAELEALLVEHPSIVDAAVIPKYDEESGEVPKAFVVVKEGEHVSADEVAAFVASQSRAVQESARGRVHRRDPEEPERQDPAPRVD